MRGIDDRRSLSDGPRVPAAAPRGFWHAAKQFLFGVAGVALITFVAVQVPGERFPSPGIGPGTICLLYLIVIVLVSHRGGFVASAAVSLIAACSLNYFVQPLLPSLRAKNPLDIVATLAFLITAWVITGIVARLRERNALLDGLLEQAPQANALMDLDTRLFRVNREFTRIFGYTPQEALGRRLIDLIVPGEMRDRTQSYTERLAQGQRLEEEVVRQRKDGSRLHVLMVGAPVTMPSGATAVYAMYRDITKRKAVEAALQAVSIRLMEVQETERKHLARELHDEIGQMLTGLRLLLGPSEDATGKELTSRLERARTIVDDLLGRIRRLSFDLRPADLDELGLLPALLALFERYTAQTGVLVDFKHQGVAGRFAPPVETAVYRVIQEALTNTARHAGVAGVTVRLWTDTGKLQLQVADRGCGFDPEVTLKAPRCSGLMGMRERIGLLGGSLNIESSPGAGTTITAELPAGETTVA